MPRTTINTIVEEALGEFPLETQQKMIDAGLLRESLSALSIPGMPILMDEGAEGSTNSPWSGRDLNELDLDSPLDEAYIVEVRHIIQVIIWNLCPRKDRLKSVA